MPWDHSREVVLRGPHGRCHVRRWSAWPSQIDSCTNGGRCSRASNWSSFVRSCRMAASRFGASRSLPDDKLEVSSSLDRRALSMLYGIALQSARTQFDICRRVKWVRSVKMGCLRRTDLESASGKRCSEPQLPPHVTSFETRATEDMTGDHLRSLANTGGKACYKYKYVLTMREQRRARGLIHAQVLL